MGQYLKLFETHENYEDFVNSKEMLKPNVSHCVSENEVHYNPIIDYSKQYLTIESLSDNNIFSWNGSVKYNGNPIYFSIDNGETWDMINSNTSVNFITLNEGDKLLLKSTNSTYDYIEDGYGRNCNIQGSNNFNIYGNTLSMIYGDNFIQNNTLSGLMISIRGSLISAENLILPSLFEGNGSLFRMFDDCTSLTIAPNLPATTLTEWCYASMFYRCTNLTTAPELPATTLANSCYSGMFADCISLTNAPMLPATTLINSCYEGMFSGCTSLTVEADVPDIVTPVSSTYCSEMYCGCNITSPNNKYNNDAYYCRQPK